MSELLVSIISNIGLALAISLLWFDLSLNLRIKNIAGLDPTKHIKPFDCVFCITMWVNICFLISFSIAYQSFIGSIIFLAFSYVVSKLADKIWG